MYKETASSVIPERLHVKIAPHLHTGETLTKMMYSTIVALFPAFGVGIYLFGIRAVQTVILSVLTAIIVEAISQKIRKKEVTIYDGSAILLGFLFALMLPATTPWWMVITGSALSMIIGRVLFGGLGNNPFNAVLIGWVILRLSWPDLLYTFPEVNDIPESPLQVWKDGGLESLDGYGFTLLNYFLGSHTGFIGVVCVPAILVGGLFLLIRRNFSWHAPFGYLLAAFILSGIVWLVDREANVTPLFHLFTGSLMFAAFFLVTDFGTTPVTPWGKFIFGIIAGALTITIREWGTYVDGVPFAILLANATTPILDRIKSRPFGLGRNSSA